MPQNLGRWVIGLVTAISALGALFIASGAEEHVMYYTALLFFIAAVLFIFGLIKHSFDEEKVH